MLYNINICTIVNKRIRHFLLKLACNLKLLLAFTFRLNNEKTSERNNEKAKMRRSEKAIYNKKRQNYAKYRHFMSYPLTSFSPNLWPFSLFRFFALITKCHIISTTILIGYDLNTINRFTMSCPYYTLDNTDVFISPIYQGQI